MFDSFSVSELFDVSPQKAFGAWLDSKEHTAFTGGAAQIEPFIGGKFNVWDDYIWGKTLVIDKYSHIVQIWRTTEFSKDDADSIVDITFEQEKEGTRITINHTNIPEGQGVDYKNGWISYYFEPMKKYFKLQ